MSYNTQQECNLALQLFDAMQNKLCTTSLKNKGLEKLNPCFIAQN
jgi:hypothetical protein